MKPLPTHRPVTLRDVMPQTSASQYVSPTALAVAKLTAFIRRTEARRRAEVQLLDDLLDAIEDRQRAERERRRKSRR